MKARIILALLALGILIPVLTGVFHLSLMLVRILGAVVVVGCVVYVIAQQSMRKQ